MTPEAKADELERYADYDTEWARTNEMLGNQDGAKAFWRSAALKRRRATAIRSHLPS